MDHLMQLELLLSTPSNYSKYISSFLAAALNSKNKCQVTKDILLYCRNTLSLAGKSEAKLLAMQLVRDLLEREGFSAHLMDLIDKNILDLVVEACGTTEPDAKAGKQMQVASKTAQQTADGEFARMCIESIMIWAKEDPNKKDSRFVKAFQLLKQRQIKLGATFKFDSTGFNSKSLPSGGSSFPSLRSFESQSPLEPEVPRQSILFPYNQIVGYFKQEVSKSAANPSYRADVYKTTHKLSKFHDSFKKQFSKMSADESMYGWCSQFGQRLRELLGRLRKDGLRYAEMVDILDKGLSREIIPQKKHKEEIPKTNIAEREVEEKKIEYVIGRKFDSGSILDSIHRKIEVEEKKAGLIGDFEFKKFSLVKSPSECSDNMKCSKLLTENNTERSVGGQKEQQTETRFCEFTKKLRYA